MKRFEKTIENKKGNIIINNIKFIIGFCVGALLVGIIMAIAWPDRIAKLSNGEEEIVSIGEKSITANDLYDELKKGGSLDATINLVDQFILTDKYDLDEEAKKYAKEQSVKIYNQFEQYYGFSKVEFLENNNFEDEDAFLEYLYYDYYYQRYYNDYTKDLITDDDINDFYKDDVFGDKKVVLFSSSDDEKMLENIRSALKKGTSISSIKKKYSNATVNELTLTYKDYADYSESLWTKVKTLEKKEYSDVVDDNILGKVVVYISSTSDKPDLKDIKDDVVDVIVAKKQNEDNNLYYQAFIELRTSYNVEFKETNLKKEYEEFVKSHK